MKTFACTTVRGGMVVALLLPALISMFAGCGPSRKQYAINEALLIDQTRILENEVYRTRYQLQKCLDENERLRQELGLLDQNESSPAGQAGPARGSQTRGGTASEVITTDEDASISVPRPVRPARTHSESEGRSPLTPKEMIRPLAPAPGPRTQEKFVPAPATAPGATPGRVPSPRSAFPTLQESPQTPQSPSDARTEVLPETIVVPVSRNHARATAPPLSHADNAKAYSATSAQRRDPRPASRPVTAPVAPPRQAPQQSAPGLAPASSPAPADFPQLILQDGTTPETSDAPGNTRTSGSMPGLSRPIEPTNEPTPVTGWIWSTEEKTK
ncbi:MAG: hypothetical protein Q4G68_13225 [Planctomycetia bacterium]|nr:hypothetical protein [Planctomycetia bacterium]